MDFVFDSHQAIMAESRDGILQQFVLADAPLQFLVSYRFVPQFHFHANVLRYTANYYYYYY